MSMACDMSEKLQPQVRYTEAFYRPVQMTYNNNNNREEISQKTVCEITI